MAQLSLHVAHYERNSGNRLPSADLSNRNAEVSGPGLDVRAAGEGKPVHRLYRSMQGEERSEEFLEAEHACLSGPSGFALWLAHVVFKGRTPPYVPQELSMAHTFCVPKSCRQEELEPVATVWVEGNIRHIVLNAVNKGLTESGLRFSDEEAAREMQHIRNAIHDNFPVHVWLESFERKTPCEQELHAQWGYFWEHSGQRFEPGNDEELRQQEAVIKARRLCERADFGFAFWIAHALLARGPGGPLPEEEFPFTFSLCLPKACAINEAEPIATFIVHNVMTVDLGDVMGEGASLDGINVNMQLQLISEPEPLTQPPPQAESAAGPLLLEEGLPCELPRQFVFLDTSWHSGARLDVAAVLASLNQTVLLPRFLGVPRNPPWPQLRTKGLGELTAPETGSEVFHSVLRHPWTGGRIGKLSEQEVRLHFEALRTHPLLAKVDAIICTSALSFCELWLPFNKTIVAVSSMGGIYSLGRCTAREWSRLDRNLRAMASSKSPRHLLTANGRWSAEVLRLYAGVEPLLLESFPWFYVQPAAWRPSRGEVLVHCFKVSPPKMCPQLTEEMTRRVADHSTRSWDFRDIYELYPSYELEDLARHRALVAVPYGDFNFAVAEVYALNVPLLLPSPSFLTELCPGTPPCYINETLVAPVAETVESLGDGMGCAAQPGPCPRHQQWLERAEAEGANPHPHELPEAACANRQAWSYWLQFIEAYRYPHAMTFDSWEELAALLDTTNFDQLHELMKASAVQRARRLRRRWCLALQEALVDEKPREVPKSYEAALAWLGVESILDV